MQDCLKPNDTRQPGERVLFLVGDSHMAHLVPAFQNILGQSFTIRLLASICGFAPESAEEGYGPTAPYWTTLCRDFHEENLAQLDAGVQRGDIVAVSNIAQKLKGGAPAEDFAALIVYLSHMISARGATVIVLEDTPWLPMPGASCVPTVLNPSAATPCELPKSVSEAYVQPSRSALSTIARNRSDIIFFDYHDLFCDNHNCGALIPGTQTLGILDQHHMTEFAAAYVAPFLCSQLKDKGLFA